MLPACEFTRHLCRVLRMLQGYRLNKPSPRPSGFLKAGHYPQTVPLETEAVVSAWEDHCFAVPKGQARIAQRFNAGLDAKSSRVLKGRLMSNPTSHPSVVPSGLVCDAGYFPALKRRVILKLSLRDNGSRQHPSPLSRQPEALAIPSKTFRGHSDQPCGCGTQSFLNGRGGIVHRCL